MGNSKSPQNICAEKEWLQVEMKCRSALKTDHDFPMTKESAELRWYMLKGLDLFSTSAETR
jgi:hypothetical protein